MADSCSTARSYGQCDIDFHNDGYFGLQHDHDYEAVPKDAERCDADNKSESGIYGQRNAFDGLRLKQH
jgi:hypothetical protein